MLGNSSHHSRQELTSVQLSQSPSTDQYQDQQLQPDEELPVRPQRSQRSPSPSRGATKRRRLLFFCLSGTLACVAYSLVLWSHTTQSMMYQTKADTNFQGTTTAAAQASSVDAVEAISSRSNNEKQHFVEDESKDTALKTTLRTLHTMENDDSNKNHMNSGPGIPTSTSCPSTPIPASDIRTTLVLQCSLNRIWILKETCARWKDPIVAVVSLGRKEHRMNKLGRAAALTGFNKNCPQLTLVEYVLDDSPPVASDMNGNDDAVYDEEEDQQDRYPVNRLRNVGLDHVRTSHVLTLDVDFVPSQNLHEVIRKVLVSASKPSASDNANNENSNYYDEKHAIVVPAFERKKPRDDDGKSDYLWLKRNSKFIPRTFDELRECVFESEQCEVFRGISNYNGHSSTRSFEWLQRWWYEGETPNYYDSRNRVGDETERSNMWFFQRWFTPSSAEPEQQEESVHQKPIRSIPCIESNRYEPYVVLQWCRTASAAYESNNKTSIDSAPNTRLRRLLGAGIGSEQQQRSLASTNTTTPVSMKPLAPYYDERFYGYGKNKIQHISHLRMSGYSFYVLPEGFVTHNPHPDSQSKQVWKNRTSSLRDTMDNLYPEFLRDLEIKYGKDAKTPICRTRNVDTIGMFDDTSSCPVDLPESDIRTTMVAQCSLDRVWILEETCRRFRDPIVAVVGIRHDEDSSQLAAAVNGWKDACPHLKLIEYKLTAEQSLPDRYPVNHMRNVGLDAVATSHVLVVDVDFVPSQDLHSTIDTVLVERQKLRDYYTTSFRINVTVIPQQEAEAIVVPAFERLSPSASLCRENGECEELLKQNSSFIPRSFEALRQCVNETQCDVFHVKQHRGGHSSTRSEDWLERKWYERDDGSNLSRRPHDIRRIRCLASTGYEPYVVVRWCPSNNMRKQSSSPSSNVATAKKPTPMAPYFDERFHGYGLNKIQHVSHLRLSGYQFSILPEGFLCHSPHTLSKASKLFKSKKGDAASELRTSMMFLYRGFLNEVKSLNKDKQNFVLEKCPSETKKPSSGTDPDVSSSSDDDDEDDDPCMARRTDVGNAASRLGRIRTRMVRGASRCKYVSGQAKVIRRAPNSK